MSKTGRNDPCPCGSGKKYKHCCGEDKVIPFPSQAEDERNGDPFEKYRKMTENWDKDYPPPSFMEMQGRPNKATELINELAYAVKQRVFKSSEELDEFVRNYDSIRNTRPVPDFLGLSPLQMHSIITNPFDDNAAIVSLSAAINEIGPEKIPILFQLQYFLKKLQEPGPLKATQKGNLPRAFVRDLYENRYRQFEEFDFKPNREDDFPLITAHKHLLISAGIIKKQYNAYSLTKKGRAVIEKNDMDTLYELLFKTWIDKFNWGYLDGYGTFGLIQAGTIFSLYILKLKAARFIEGKKLGGIFLNAFPDLAKESAPLYSTPEEEAIDCYILRFLRRFCVPFGLVDEECEGELKTGRNCRYKTTPLFRTLFTWKV